MNNSLKPLKIYAYIFCHLFNQPQIPALVPLCVLGFIKQVEANRLHATNDCGQYPGSIFRKEFRSGSSYSYILWLNLFILLLNPIPNVAFPFWDSYSNEKNPNSQTASPTKNPPCAMSLI